MPLGADCQESSDEDEDGVGPNVLGKEKRQASHRCASCVMCSAAYSQPRIPVATLLQHPWSGLLGSHVLWLRLDARNLSLVQRSRNPSHMETKGKGGDVVTRQVVGR